MIRSRANSRVSSVQGSMEDLLTFENETAGTEEASEQSSEGHSHTSTLLSDPGHHKVNLVHL